MICCIHVNSCLNFNSVVSFWMDKIYSWYRWRFYFVVYIYALVRVVNVRFAVRCPYLYALVRGVNVSFALQCTCTLKSVV